jgi:parvulin-like peptidyl-prolyl isomerase
LPAGKPTIGNRFAPIRSVELRNVGRRIARSNGGMSPTVRAVVSVAALACGLFAAGCSTSGPSINRHDLYAAGAVAGPGSATRDLPTAGAPTVGNRTDGSAAAGPAGPAAIDPGAARPARPASAGDSLDDVTIVRVNQDSIRFSTVYERMRPRLVPRPRNPTDGQAWDKAVKELFAVELEERINEVLVFDDLWKQVAAENQSRIRLIVDQLVEADIKKAGSRDRWLAALRAEQRTEDQHRRALLLHVLVSVVFNERVRNKVEPGPAEITAEYERRKAEFERTRAGASVGGGGALVRFRQIDVPRDPEFKHGPIPGKDRPGAEQVRDYLAERLKAGADFAELATKHSATNAARGGLAPVDELPEGSHAVPACNKAIAALNPGQCTVEPVAGPGVWYFFKLESRRTEQAAAPEKFRSRAEMDEEIREQLKLENKHREFRRYLAELRSKAWFTPEDSGRVNELLLRRAAADAG